MGKLIDLTGRTFGSLTVLRRGDTFHAPPSQHPIRKWLARCVCGVEKEFSGSNLRKTDKTRTKSCGCLRLENINKNGLAKRLVHGGCSRLRKVPGYDSWRGAKDRCFNPNHKEYFRYGGRGITMSKEWAESYAQFALDMGPRPKGASLDRIDPNGNYEPSNCRWASSMIQVDNRRGNKLICYNGKTMPLKQWILELEQFVV